MVPDADYRIKLQVFEGPLDLLLFLIRKNELDIYDIPIESVTRQYIDALHAMQRLDIDVLVATPPASAFITPTVE